MCLYVECRRTAVHQAEHSWRLTTTRVRYVRTSSLTPSHSHALYVHSSVCFVLCFCLLRRMMHISWTDSVKLMGKDYSEQRLTTKWIHQLLKTFVKKNQLEAVSLTGKA